MSSKSLPKINLGRCDRCGLCVQGCPEHALMMSTEGPVFNHPITCTYCTDCEVLCPTGAIRTPLKVRWA